MNPAPIVLAPGDLATLLIILAAVLGGGLTLIAQKWIDL